jgi:hypothetical protein
MAVCVLVLFSCACAPTLGLRAGVPMLSAERLDCNVAPVALPANQIQLRISTSPSCDVLNLDGNVLADRIVLAPVHIERRLNSGILDHFDSSPFVRPKSDTLLSVEVKGTCSDGKSVTGAAQCRVP